jgi:hypothetical protein
MSVKTSDGKLLTRDSFRDHETPHHGRITDSPTEVAWSKNLSREKLRFFVQNAYRPEGFSSEWGFGCPVGNYIREAVFVLPVPATLQPEARVEGVWKPLGLSDKGDTWPEALRWRNGESCVTVSIKPLQVEHPGGFRHRSDGIPGFEALPPVRSIKGFEVRAVETKERSPGGKNSFCPFPVLQVRLYVNIGLATRAGVICDFTFTD